MNTSDDENEDLGSPLTVSSLLALLLGSEEMTQKEAAYLLLTEYHTQRGGGKGCWLTVNEFVPILKVNRSGVLRIRAGLLRKGFIVKAGEKTFPKEHSTFPNQTLPIFKTWWSDAFRRPAPTPPRLTAQDGGASCAVRRKEDRKNKDNNTSGDPPAASRPRGKHMPFIINEKPNNTIPDELARRLHQKWMSSPASTREGRGIHHKYPSKVWPDRMRKLVKAEWSGGESAFLLQFERLMKVWERLPPDVLPDPKRLYSNGSSYYYLKILLPAIEKVESNETELVTDCPPVLERQWQEVSNFGWAGKPQDWKLRLTCLVRTHQALKRVREILASLGKSGTFLLDAASGFGASKFLLDLRPYVEKVLREKPGDSFPYLSPKFCLSVSRCDEHLGFRRLAEKAVKDDKRRADLFKAIKGASV